MHYVVFSISDARSQTKHRIYFFVWDRRDETLASYAFGKAVIRDFLVTMLFRSLSFFILQSVIHVHKQNIVSICVFKQYNARSS